MKKLQFNTGSNGYCVARPNGSYAVLFFHSHIELGGAKLPLPNSEDPIWLDLSASGKIAGASAQVSNKAWELSSVSWKSSKCYSTPRCVIYDNDKLITVQTPQETGSLGYIQVSDSGQLVKTIDHYANIPLGINEYIIRGDITVGHGGEGPYGANPCIAILPDKSYRLLDEGNCLAQKFYRDDDNLAISWINGSLSKILFLTAVELKNNFPIYNPHPSEPPPMSIPNHLEVVKAARLKYNSLSGKERAGKIVNEVAWNLRSEGAGTFFKSSGDNYNQRSLDVIIYKPNGETFDILGDAEGSANPQWARTQPTGFGDISKWRSATDPGNSNPIPPTPTDPARDLLKSIRSQINEFFGDTA